ncbi:MAG: hypothetical protein Q7J31_02945, partial [Syntrophales bacterium]|nr:hypothetical protein [Syntrophales bacterium]
SPPYISEIDIKNYLLYIVEEKQSAASTLNQAINALKFYYGSSTRKFIYAIKRPRKERILPAVLSKGEVASIISSVENVKYRAIFMIVYSAGLQAGYAIKDR